MNVPVSNIKDVLTAAIDIDKARKTPVSVLVMIDESASPDFQVFVRSGFSSESVNSRLMVGYFPTMMVDPDVEVDLVVVAAGEGAKVGEVSSSFREKGTLVLVVAESGPRVLQIAKDQGHSLDSADVIAPANNEALDEDIKGDLADRIGSWMAERLPKEKHLAFSIAYPFMRRPLAYAAINATAVQNAGIGAAAFVPGADMPLMTANQMKMVLQIAAAYGQPLEANRIKELLAVLGGGFVCRGIARNVVGIVPVGGWAIKGAMGFAGTQAIGRAALDYFEHGGDAAGLASVVGHTRDNVMHAAAAVAKQPTTKAVASVVVPGVAKIGKTVAKNARPVANAVLSTALGSGEDIFRAKGSSSQVSDTVLGESAKKGGKGFSVMAGGGKMGGKSFRKKSK